jgi:hypothetical protein
VFDAEETLYEVACPHQPARELLNYTVSMLMFIFGAGLLGAAVLKTVIIGCDSDEDGCSFEPPLQLRLPGALLVAFAVLNCFVAKQYICSIRITPSYVGVQSFQGKLCIG